MVRKVCSRIAVMYLGQDRRARRHGHRVLRSGPSLHARLALGRAGAGGAAATRPRNACWKASRRARSTCRSAAASAPAARSPSTAAGSRSRRSIRAGPAVSPPAIWSSATSRRRGRLRAREESHGGRRHRGGSRCRRLRACRPAQRGPEAARAAAGGGRELADGRAPSRDGEPEPVQPAQPARISSSAFSGPISRRDARRARSRASTGAAAGSAAALRSTARSRSVACCRRSTTGPRRAARAGRPTTCCRISGRWRTISLSATSPGTARAGRSRSIARRRRAGGRWIWRCAMPRWRKVIRGATT